VHSWKCGERNSHRPHPRRRRRRLHLLHSLHPFSLILPLHRLVCLNDIDLYFVTGPEDLFAEVGVRNEGAALSLLVKLAAEAKGENSPRESEPALARLSFSFLQ
jgi:hypothetical protein